MLKLNLGCGFDHQPQSEGWINIDIDENKTPDIIWDLNNLFPSTMRSKYNILKNSVDEVLIKHCLEHLNPTLFYELMKDLWKLCVNNATITIIVPHWQQEAAFEPDHKWVYPPRTFKMIVNEYPHLVAPAKFEIVELVEKDEVKEPQTKCVYKVIK
ncbi:MAG: hypothetical protein AABY22_30870 [Nanoarchaeota archaeon]